MQVRATRPASLTQPAPAPTPGKHFQPTTVVGITHHFRGRHCRQNWELWDAVAMAGCWGVGDAFWVGQDFAIFQLSWEPRIIYIVIYKRIA